MMTERRWLPLSQCLSRSPPPAYRCRYLIEIMGLDAVEIVMDVEDHFGIAIQSHEAERVRTVGDLVSLIQSRIEAAHVAYCPTLASFLQVRSCVREIATDDRLRIRTGTRIVDVLSGSQRRRLWKCLDDMLDAPAPNLRRPPMMRKSIASLVVAAIFLATAAAVVVDFAILPVTLALAAIFAITLNLLTVRFRIYPPDTLATFGELSRRLTGVKAATKLLHLRSIDAILDELRPIVVDTLGVDSSEVVASARFVEDLGLG